MASDAERDLELRLQGQLDEIYREARRQAAPIIAQLVEIEARKLPGPMVVLATGTFKLGALDFSAILRGMEKGKPDGHN